jgi:CheY-like chemotaxis protein
VSAQRLLLADDDAAIVAVVRRYFDGRGWEVETCLKADEALHQLESKVHFDALICDLHFTPAHLSEGLQILDRARRLRPALALLLFTGAIEPGLHAEASRLGVHAVITKPVPLASLHEAVLRAMKSE